MPGLQRRTSFNREILRELRDHAERGSTSTAASTVLRTSSSGDEREPELGREQRAAGR
jgi:hypothetical protein